jgi:hypothetical protein
MFADPYDLARVYRFAHCYVAFSRALKIVTGDEQVSPHITRHSFLSFRAESCLLQVIQGVEEPNPLEVLRCDAGHARIETTFTAYVHLVERTMRRSMDAYLSSKLTRACDVARWTGANQEAIRQSRHRHKDWDPWQALHAALPGKRQQALTKQALLDAAPAAVTLTLEHVLNLARDWLDGRTVAATSSRCGLSDRRVKQTIEAISMACRRICTIRGTKGLTERNWRAWMDDECDFKRLTQARWERAARTIVGQDCMPQVEQWLSCCARGGIDLADQWAGSLLGFLHAAGFGPDRFVVKATIEGRAHAARAPFLGTFGVLPTTELVAPRRGRSASYALLLTTGASGDRLVPGRSSEMKALLALLIAASAYGCTLEKEEL